MEVIVLDYRVPGEIVASALEEDVDAIGISYMSGGQVDTTQRLMAELAEQGYGALPVVIGGTIRPFDIPALEAAGVSAIFRGGEPLSAVVETFDRLAADFREERSGRRVR